MRLYSYFRSSAAFRVRIALAVKDIDYQMISIHLTKDGGQQKTDAYKKINSQGLVPALETDRGDTLTQSLAILEYIEETYPQPHILPKNAVQRAYVRSISNQIACDIHPLNNLRVLKYLEEKLLQSKDRVNGWYQYWIEQGLKPLEETIATSRYKGIFCCGDQVSMADICLIPQLYNARRFNCRLDIYPTLLTIEQECLKQPAFIKSLPQNQPDAE